MNAAEVLGRCPECKAPGAGPFIHRGRVFAVCDLDRLRWLVDLTASQAARLDGERLGYTAAEDR